MPQVLIPLKTLSMDVFTEATHRVEFTAEQWASINEAIKAYKREEMSDAQCIQKLCCGWVEGLR